MKYQTGPPNMHSSDQRRRRAWIVPKNLPPAPPATSHVARGRSQRGMVAETDCASKELRNRFISLTWRFDNCLHGLNVQ